MFDNIKGIIGDIGSGEIKGQRIALSQEQLSTLDLKLKVLSGKLSEAQRKIVLLEAENAYLKEQVQSLQLGGLPKETGDILRYLFDLGRDASIEHLAQHFGLEMSVVEFRIEELIE